MYEGIKILDLNLKEQGIIKVPFDSEPHGLAIDEKNQKLYVGQPGRDSIGEYSILKRKNMVKWGSCVGKKPFFYFLNPLVATDIDDQSSFKIAELLFKKKIFGKKAKFI